MNLPVDGVREIDKTKSVTNLARTVHDARASMLTVNTTPPALHQRQQKSLHPVRRHWDTIWQ